MIKLGNINEDEKREILIIYERIMGLNELSLTLDTFKITDYEKKGFQKKIDIEKEKANSKYNIWWSEKIDKYKWESCKNSNWTIDFITNEVFLIEKQ
ncbi:CXXX repeat peptide modification system protein [Clostridium sp. ATCC 25772]|uniref:CXXX repeat peptide modification system protein n=1 Tax=Clostridium sp. ATCC 25772 TaxID=1676991 RepID=UPI0007834704|nr:CXXX repeat peptide modification system protein [Clostridium sp. ATCC 25772]